MPAEPKPRRRGAPRKALALGGILLIVWAVVKLTVGGLAIATPALLAARLGPPAPDLPWTERTLLAFHLALRSGALDQPAGEPEAVVELEVRPGETAAQVVDRLHAAAVVKDAALLKSYLRYRGLDRGVQAGLYELRGSMTLEELAQALQSAQSPAINFTIPEGWRREQIAESLSAAEFTFGAEEFLAHSESLLTESLSLIPDSLSGVGELPSLEGFLFPDTYRLDLDATAEDLVRAMVENFDRRVDGSLRSRWEAAGLSLIEAVILASIVEREAARAEERPMIASVFLNRLRLGMLLEADPTVQYALGQQPDGNWWKSPLSLADLDIDSPFNTYRFSGLPPAPIANPGLASLKAVAEPAASEFLFFRAACDSSGGHVFSRSLEEHVSLACQ